MSERRKTLYQIIVVLVLGIIFVYNLPDNRDIQKPCENQYEQFEMER